MFCKRLLLLIILCFGLAISTSSLADCPSCFQFFGCTVKTKDKREIKGFLEHNNYGYGGKSSPYDVKGRDKITVYSNYYNLHKLSFYDTLRKLRPHVRWNMVFVSKTGITEIKTSEIESIEGNNLVSGVYDSGASLVVLSEKAIWLLTLESPSAVNVYGLNIIVISYNKTYDNSEKLNRVYKQLEEEYLYNDKSVFRMETRKMLENKYQNIKAATVITSQINTSLYELGYDKLGKELEMRDIVFVKPPEGGD